MFITIDSLSLFIYLFFGSWILDSNNLLFLIDIIIFGDDFFLAKWSPQQFGT